MTFRNAAWLVAAVAALGAASAPMISTTLLGRQVDGSFLLVNGNPIGAQAQRLRDNDVITLAGVKMGFFEG